MKHVVTLLIVCIAHSVFAGSVFYSARVDGVWNIYEVPLTGGESVQWTDYSDIRAISHPPRVSPDGRQIVFTEVSGDDLIMCVMSLETGEKRLLKTGKGVASTGDWSPDGTKLVYAHVSSGTAKSFRPTNADIMIYDLLDDSVTLLVETPVQECGPRWSPDGNYISFSRRVSQVSGRENAKGAGFQIVLFDLNTGTETQLTDNFCENWPPEWSPEGKHLLFESDRDVESAWGCELYLMSVESGEAVRLTTHNGACDQAVFGLDGSSIIYRLRRHMGDAPCLSHYDIKTGETAEIFTVGDYCSSPSIRK